MVGRPLSIHSARHSILCVDDEPQLLEGLALTVGHLYHVELAAGGRAALEKLREHPQMSVIVSDMRMPEMDGVEFLSESRNIAPDARRILLTGYADTQSAIAAVNEGRIFKYLSKPCSSAELLDAIAAAVADYEADIGERSDIRRSLTRDARRRPSYRPREPGSSRGTALPDAGSTRRSAPERLVSDRNCA
jgi:DNA-binding NtrC family response regulator